MREVSVNKIRLKVGSHITFLQALFWHIEDVRMEEVSIKQDWVAAPGPFITGMICLDEDFANTLRGRT